MPRDESEIKTDITVYGATGFVAKFILRYLLEVAGKEDKPIRLTLAGRNERKLQELMSILDPQQSTLNVLVADSDDLAGLKKMAERTRVVISCAGPFEHYSGNVVAACAETGADYVDITGEFYWVGKMRMKYGALSQKSGARIISQCGFDSVPSDMSIFAAVQALRQVRGDKVEIEHGTTWFASEGFASGGTVLTMTGMPFNPIHMFFEKGKLRSVPFLMDDPLIMSHPTRVRHNPDYKCLKNNMARAEWWNQLPWLDSVLAFGCSIPFFMAVTNNKVVYASAVGLNYGPRFTYLERMLPIGFKWTRMLGIISIVPGLFVHFAILTTLVVVSIPVLGKKLATWLVPAGSGPSDETCAKGHASVYAEVVSKAAAPTRSGNVDRATCFLQFQGDPGMLITAQTVCESAFSLLWDRTELPKRTEDGFGSPAELLGNVLLKRLQSSKVRQVVVTTKVLKDRPKHEKIVYMH